MAGFAAGNTNTSCAFFENEIILGDPSSSKNSCTGGQGDVLANMGASGQWCGQGGGGGGVRCVNNNTHLFCLPTKVVVFLVSNPNSSKKCLWLLKAHLNLNFRA